MKKMLISMLAMAAMVSCSSESDPIDEVNPTGDSKVEIKLNTGVVSVATKATETTLATTPTISLIREDIEGEDSPAWTSSNLLTYTLANDGTISLQDAQKYYDGAKKSHFIGYAPAGTRNGTNITYSITGEEDIICSDPVNVGTKTTVQQGALKFKHMLSEVQLVLDGEAANVDKTFGKITNISIIEISTDLTLTLGETPKIASTANDNLGTIAIVSNNTTNFSVLKTNIVPKFVLPGYGSDESNKELKIKIEFENHADITVSVKNIATTVEPIVKGLQPGHKHVITLNFKDNVTITATIGEIIDGGSGNEDIKG